MTRVEQAIDAADVSLRMLAWAAILGSIAYLTGCGSAVQASARACSAATLVVSTAGGAVDEARDAALDAVEEAHPQIGPERSAALDAEDAKWRPVGVALDMTRAALRGWLDATTIAAAGADLDVPRLLRIVRDVLRLYESIVTAAEELGIDDLPSMPQEVRDLVVALGGG